MGQRLRLGQPPAERHAASNRVKNPKSHHHRRTTQDIAERYLEGLTSRWSMCVQNLVGKSTRAIMVFAVTISARGCPSETNRQEPINVQVTSPSAPRPSSTVKPRVSAKVFSVASSPVAWGSSSVVQRHEYQGGNWTSCADGFKVSNQPQRDVTRLSLLCAPYQGMRRYGRTWFGKITAESNDEMDFRLAKGQCARVFATAETSLSSWTVDVVGPGEVLVGHAHTKNGLALANPTGAFCVDRTGDYHVRVKPIEGSGLVAAEVWTLPTL
ncbi:MAG: hypothetical protein CSA75_00825 [Sorangium cellulosum]|nr:MAG: hypothetical protein CSA75_00825 [Sorangium cellulosum]